MKRNILVMISLCAIFNYYTSQNLMAQKNKKGQEAAAVGAAVFGGLIAAKLAVEEIKEQLESDAVTHILSNYPEIKEFRLKCLFEKGENWSDESETGVLTFQLTILNKSRKTEERKILLRFNNKKFMNEYGVRVNKVEYMLIDENEWDSMMAFFVNLIAVGDTLSSIEITDRVTDYLVPLYNQSNCDNAKVIKAMNYNLTGQETFKCYVKIGKSEFLSNLRLMKNGLEHPKISYDPNIYPFYRLKGDDYIVGDFSSRLRIFANEKTMGLFLKWMDKTILLSRNIIGEIHSFLNFQDINFENIDYSFYSTENNSSTENYIDSTNVSIKQPGLYYNGVLCVIIEEISESEVKIKYATETGRGYYKEIVNINDLEEVK